MAKRKRQIPGCLYERNGRWWWKGVLPGQKKTSAAPLKPAGAKYATRERDVAEVLARELVHRTMIEAEWPVDYDGTVAALVGLYRQHARDYYRRPDGAPTGEAVNIQLATGHLLDFCPTLQTEDFGPKLLKDVRQAMIDETRTDADGKEVRRLSRKVINQRVNTIRRMFRWAVGEELVPASVASALQAVDGLRQGRSDARETEPVKAVDVAFVNRVLPYCPPTLQAMIRVQLYTGMRSGELVKLRPVDIDTSGKLWSYRPQQHKTSHHGHERVIYIGPKAQKALRPFLKRRIDAYCFSPAEAMEQRWQEANASRTTPEGQGNERGSNRKADPERQPGEVYDTNGYRQALGYAIKRARADGQTAPDFTPHQLRHTAATLLRKELGLDAARVVLGHRSLSMADDYAELDAKLAMQAMAKLG